MLRSGETLNRLADMIGGSLAGIDHEAAAAINISDVVHDSRQAGPGVLFVAVPGFTTDGHNFVHQAVSLGSPAVTVERPPDVDIPHVLVDDSRGVLGRLAAAVHGQPSTKMDVVGVTGTNGKTSVVQLVESVAADAGRPVGVIGTLGVRIDGMAEPSERTTPEADDFQRLLAKMSDAGVSVVAAEVSSHALRLGRVDGTSFKIAAFTNLSQDHLDFHRDMEDYFLAKASLFEPDRSEKAVIWVDDAAGRRLADSCTIPVTTVGTSDADLILHVSSSGFDGSVFRLGGSDLSVELRLPLPGSFMVANGAVAAAICHRLGFSPDQISSGLASASAIPGRFEPVANSLGVGIVVDYSHTPAGIAAAIEASREICRGSIIAVLGAGGDRDKTKRPLMGAASSSADHVVVTSDNPRSERPAAIIADVMAGMTRKAEVIEDRRAAIRRALMLAKPGDLVLIMGKGHESYQEIDGERLPFDDRLVAAEEASAL